MTVIAKKNTHALPVEISIGNLTLTNTEFISQLKVPDPFKTANNSRPARGFPFMTQPLSPLAVGRYIPLGGGGLDPTS